MRDSTVLKAVLTSLIVLGSGIPMGHAQGLFFGMMSERTPTVYNSHSHEITRQQAKDMFKAMDVDQNGIVTKDEFEAGYDGFFSGETDQKMADRRFQALDALNNGKVSEGEFIANRNVPLDDNYVLALEPAAGGDDGE